MVKLVECMTRQSRGIDFNWHGHIRRDRAILRKPKSNRSFEAAMSRRQVVYGLGPAVTSTDSDITGVRLPTCRQVLRCFIFHVEHPKSKNVTKRDSAKIVLEKVLPFYAKANIPIIIREIPKKRRSSECVQTKLAKEQENRDKTFKLWPDNVEELVNDKEDLLFLESMKTDRAASFGSLDTKLQGILQRRVIRVGG